jgi:CheY-like chemotaxis protein
MMNAKLLLLEHDEDDVYITQSVFNELKYPVKLDIVTTANDLFEYLAACIDKNVDLPDLILLNYNAVPAGALEIISALKASPLFNVIPVIVGCGVVNEKIVAACYAKGVSSFIKKAESTAGAKKSISNFINYWFDCVLLPQHVK